MQCKHHFYLKIHVTWIEPDIVLTLRRSVHHSRGLASQDCLQTQLGSAVLTLHNNCSPCYCYGIELKGQPEGHKHPDSFPKRLRHVQTYLLDLTPIPLPCSQTLSSQGC